MKAYLVNFHHKDRTLRHLVSEDKPLKVDIEELVALQFKELGIIGELEVVDEGNCYYCYIKGDRHDIEVEILEMDVIKFR